MSTGANPNTSPAAPSGPVPGAAAAGALWIEKLQRAVDAASAEARSAFFYYAGFGLYFAIAVAGTSHEDLLRGSTVAMPGLGVGMPIVGFYLIVPLLFVVFHVYALLQLVILARRIGWLKRVLGRRLGRAEAFRQRLLVSPFAVSQRLFGEPRGLVPRAMLASAIWLTLVLIPLALLFATQLRFLPYHEAGVTWAHRLYILIDALLLLVLWPAIIHPERAVALEGLSTGSSAVDLPRRIVRAWRRPGPGPGWTPSLRAFGAAARLGLALLVLFVTFVVATVPGEALERLLLAESAAGDRADCGSPWRIGRWLDTVRLPDRRAVLCVTYAFFEAPETPLGLRRNIVVPEASLVVVEPSQQQIDQLGSEEAWRSKGKGVDLQGRDLRFADLSGSDLRRADLRGANLQGAVLREAKLMAARAGDIAPVEVGDCEHLEDVVSKTCLTGLVEADLTAADLRFLEGWKIDFQGADLTASRLEDAVLGHGRLDGALLTWRPPDSKVPGLPSGCPRSRADGAISRRRPPGRGTSRSLPTCPASQSGGAGHTETEAEKASDAGAEKEEPALRARGMVQRIWHEFDYSHSHDQAGYARIADLRYLLVRLILSPERCPGAEIAERDADQLQTFLSRMVRSGETGVMSPTSRSSQAWSAAGAICGRGSARRSRQPDHRCHDPDRHLGTAGRGDLGSAHPVPS